MIVNDSTARIARIRRCALRLRFRRAWKNPHTPSRLIADLLREMARAVPATGEVRG